MRRAAKQYARRLRPYLVSNWGGASDTESYSVPQIIRGIVETGLDPDFMVFAFAALLPKDQFDARVKLPYDEARAMFINCEPVQLESRDGTPGPIRN